MSRATHSPITCCDRDCAGANGCRVGGYRCAYELDERGLCEDCAAQREAAEEAEEREAALERLFNEDADGEEKCE